MQSQTGEANELNGKIEIKEIKRPGSTFNYIQQQNHNITV